jgi:hypothetical protein
MRSAISWCLFTGVVFAVAILGCPSPCGAQSVDAEIFGFTKKYCVNCHNAVDREGGLDLSRFAAGALAIGEE